MIATGRMQLQLTSNAVAQLLKELPMGSVSQSVLPGLALPCRLPTTVCLL